MKVGIVIQGPSEYIQEQKNTWYSWIEKSIPFILNDNSIGNGSIIPIFSTWKGEAETKYDKEKDICVFSETPEQSFQNFKHQLRSSFAGIQKAKELGCTHVLKIRSDLVPTHPEQFLKMIMNDRINILAYHRFIKGYFVDYLMSGPIDFMMDLWGIQEHEYFDIMYEPAEVKLTRKMFQLFYIQEKYKNQIHVFLDKLDQNNDIYWIKNKVNLSDYQVQKNTEHRGYVSNTMFFYIDYK